MNATDVTGPCAAVQYGLIMLTCGSQKMEFRMTENRSDRTLNYARLGVFQLLENQTVRQFSADPYFGLASTMQIILLDCNIV